MTKMKTLLALLMALCMLMTALPVMAEETVSGTWYLVVLGLTAGTLTEGAAADVTVIDPELEWQVDEKKFYTKGSHSPFAGRKLKGKAVLTVVKGQIVMQDGEVLTND